MLARKPSLQSCAPSGFHSVPDRSEPQGPASPLREQCWVCFPLAGAGVFTESERGIADLWAAGTCARVSARGDREDKARPCWLEGHTGTSERKAS